MEELTFYIVIAMLLLFLTILGTVFMFLVYSGVFHRVEVGAGQPPIQEVVLAYHYGRGAYKDSGYYFAELAALAPTLKSLGIYYDDPEQVEQEKLRWVVACVVAKESEKPNEELVQALQQKGYKLFTLPHVTSAVRTKFPNNTFLSFFLGIYKVYPALAAYIRENKLCAHPFMEIYDGSVIHYVAPLARQSEFYVPESLVEEDEEEESDEGRSDLSGDDSAPEKSKPEPVVEKQPTTSGVLSAASVAGSALASQGSDLRESFDRETPVEAVEPAAPAKVDEEKPARPSPAPVAQPSASTTPAQSGAPTTKTVSTPEGSSSEVDSESYEVVKPEDVSEKN